MELSFGKFIKAERLKNGYTLRKFAKKVGLSPTFISRLERDDVDSPSEEKISSIAKILNIESEILIFKAKKMPKELSKLVIDRPDLARLLRVGGAHSPDDLEELLNSLIIKKY